MTKKNLLIMVIGLGIIILIVSFGFLMPKTTSKTVDVITEKKEYQTGESLKLKIENNLRKSVCFSSCYPYYFEKKDGEWISYDYENCQDSNLVENCINSKQVKVFEVVIPSIKTGLHRLALPACLGCNIKDKFREDNWLYSNDFVIK